jgi:hypothetical protein
MSEVNVQELPPVPAQSEKIEVSQNPEVENGNRKSKKITIFFAVIFYPFLYLATVYFVGDMPICSSAVSSFAILNICVAIGRFLFFTFFWLLPLFAAVVAYGCSYVLVTSRVWNDKFYQITNKKSIFVVISVILSVIIYLIFTLALAFTIGSYGNEAKTKLVPVVAYANAHGWKSVADSQGGPSIDTLTPGYDVVFLTSQSAQDAEQAVKMILEEEGYKVEVSPDKFTEGDIDVDANMSNGNHIFSEISNNQYNNTYDEVKVPAGMTAIDIEVDDYGYAK